MRTRSPDSQNTALRNTIVSQLEDKPLYDIIETRAQSAASDNCCCCLFRIKEYTLSASCSDDPSGRQQRALQIVNSAQ